MRASSSAREPHQVSLIIWRFAGPISGTVARAHGSLDSPSCSLDVVCRLRNVVVDVLRKPMKMSCELHQPGRLVLAAFRIKFPCSWQAEAVPAPISSSAQRSSRSTETALTYWSAQCTGAARVRRSGTDASACTWLTEPCTHDSGPDFRQAADTLDVEAQP
mmetsp:Transcript_8925/g.23350  ORF Transcript_8925/g.23350 Transcript_8925/m.23350 type:complete len:161 (+) Transcript_8925:43-525(+)